jgi:hypothetical protein
MKNVQPRSGISVLVIQSSLTPLRGLRGKTFPVEARLPVIHIAHCLAGEHPPDPKTPC